jgi:dTDP-4-dehydrorhamnose 3,5-epimerase
MRPVTAADPKSPEPEKTGPIKPEPNKPVSTSVVDFDVVSTAIDGLLVLTMKQITDARGTVRELFRTSAFAEAGLPVGPWPQVNATETGHGAIRGLHGEDMIKLVAVVHGEAFGAYVDARRDSATVGQVVTVPLRPGTQVLVPAGVCNGFQSVSPGPTQYLYCFTSEWVPGMAGVAVHPLDPALGIDWPIAVDVADPAQLSAKDAAQPTLAEALSQ